MINYEQSKVKTIKALTNPSVLKRVVTDARVSTADEHQDSSYRLQFSELEKSIRINPRYEFIGIFKDCKSGRDIKHREEFTTMLELAFMGEIDVIVTKSITRFGRNLIGTINIIRSLKLNYVEVIFQKENISTFDSSIEMVLTILATHAEVVSNNISQNVLWSIKRKIRKGGNLTSRLYGYAIKGESWKDLKENMKYQLSITMID
ncbi:MAG TPA: recombinase family protein [Bacilli bacterium]|nr:recombinase family protein [Bacilli bacterium]